MLEKIKEKIGSIFTANKFEKSLFNSGPIFYEDFSEVPDKERCLFKAAESYHLPIMTEKEEKAKYLKAISFSQGYNINFTWVNQSGQLSSVAILVDCDYHSYEKLVNLGFKIVGGFVHFDKRRSF